MKEESGLLGQHVFIQAVMRALAGGLGKRRPTQAFRTLGMTAQNIDQKTTQDNFQIHT